MKKKLIGLFASVALLGAGTALANQEHDMLGTQPKNQDISGTASQPSSQPSKDINLNDQSQSSSGTSVGSTGSSTDSSMSGIGGAGTAGTGTMDRDMNKDMGKDMNKDMGKMPKDTMQGSMAAQEQMGHELTGRVVRSDAKTVYLSHMGFIVPLKIDSRTRFEGTDLKSAKDLKEGQEIRANFTIKNKTENLATSVSMGESGQGGSGILHDDMGATPDSGSLDKDRPLGSPMDSVNQGTIDDRANQPSKRTMNPGPLNNNPSNPQERTY